MTDWFEWNGKKCTDFGIHVSEHPPITLPAERSTFTNVPGRSGSKKIRNMMFVVLALLFIKMAYELLF